MGLWWRWWCSPQPSTNPLVDYHIIYALALIAVAATYAGDTWGFGIPWRKLSIVRSQPWLI